MSNAVKKARVVFSIGALHGGGSERQLVQAIKHLDRHRFVPHLYLIYRDGPLLDQVPDDVPISVFAERCTSSPMNWPGHMHRLRVADMAKYLREVRADVCYDRTFLMTLIAADAAQRVGVPNVSTIVTDPQLGFAPVAGRFQSVKKRRLTRLYRNSARVLAVSNGAARSAERFYGLEANSVRTLYNGVDIEVLRVEAAVPIDDPWWTAESDGRRVFRMVSAGRLNREKGFHLLIEALQSVKNLHPDTDFRLAILGEGQGRTALEQQIATLGLSDNVRLPGFRKDAAAWYRSADLYVLSSLLEGMPNVLLEAMALGTPVLSTNCRSGPAEILRNGEFGLLCDVGSAAALAEGMRNVLTQREEAQANAGAAAVRVGEQFSSQAAVSRLSQFLLACAASHI